MKFQFPELSRILDAMVYANHAGSLTHLQKLLAKDGISSTPGTNPKRVTIKQKGAPPVSQKTGNLSLVD